jgi:hypothetical protein
MISKQTALVAAKTETTYGIAATLAAGDAMFISDFTHNMLEGNVVDRNNITGRMGAQGSIRVEQYSSMDLSAELAGSGTAGTAPRYAPLLKASGMMETITAGTSVAYSPISSGFQSVTLGAYYKDASGAVKRALLTGSRASFAIDLSTGTVPKIDFKFQGLFNNPETATTLSGDFSGIPLPKGANKANTVSASLFGEQVQAEKVSLDAGINIKYSNLMNYEGVDCIGRSGKLTVSFRVPTVDAMATWVSRGKDNEQGAFSVTHGTTAGNIVSLSVPNAQIKTVTPSFQDDRMFISVDMDIVPLTDNGDFTITLS